MKFIKNIVLTLLFILPSLYAAEAKKRAATLAKEAVKVRATIAPSGAKVPAEISQAEMEQQKKIIEDLYYGAVQQEHEIVEAIAISAAKAADTELEKRKAQILENMVIKVQYYWIVQGLDITDAFNKAITSISNKVIVKIKQKEIESWSRFAPGISIELGLSPKLIQERRWIRPRAKRQI